jgi:hypothetical protein
MSAAGLWLRLRALLLRRRVEWELREELDFHIQRETHENIENGMDPGEVIGELVTHDYFDVLGAQPAVGRWVRARGGDAHGVFSRHRDIRQAVACLVRGRSRDRRAIDMLLVSLGWLIGIGAALLATRYLKSMLFGVTATDAVTFLVASVLVAVTAALAFFLPAFRVARVDPVTALRMD